MTDTNETQVEVTQDRASEIAREIMGEMLGIPASEVSADCTGAKLIRLGIYRFEDCHRIQAEKRTAPRSAVEAPKPLPEGARGPFAVNCETGQWFYVNHGFTWQTMPSPIDAQPTDFQSRVAGWMLDCFTPEIAADKLERADRFCEEALELVQTMPDFTKDRAHALVDYVFSREVGERGQEVGGVMVTLAALCGPCDLDMTAEAEREYARISAPAVIEKIRAKHTSKPTGSALPIPQPSLTTDDALVEELKAKIELAIKSLDQAEKWMELHKPQTIEGAMRVFHMREGVLKFLLPELPRILRALEGEG